MTSSNEVDLLLIGKTGNGKSASGNSILRRKVFESGGATSSVTSKTDYEVSEVDGRIVTVVDGPGIGDTRIDNYERNKLVIVEMEKAMATNPKGYHGFLLVLRYGQRFTGEEQDTILFLKRIFGENFVKEYCILLMTNGDTFEKEIADTGQNFEDWSRSQSGDFKLLLEECNNRIVLFNNVTKDEDIRNRQVRQLLSVVDGMSSNGQRYTDENFEMAREARERVLNEAQGPLIKDQTMRAISLILQKLEYIQASDNLENKPHQLDKLLVKTGDLINTVSSLDRETEGLDETYHIVKCIHSIISNELKCIDRSQEERSVTKEVEDGIKSNSAEETERILQEPEQKCMKVRRKGNQKNELSTPPEQSIEQERAKKQREFLTKLEQERPEKMKAIKELEKKYREIKKKNDETILNAVLGAVSWPFRKVALLFSKNKVGSFSA